MLDVRYTDDALKDLSKLGHVAADKVSAKISAYAASPSAFAHQVKKLHGQDAFGCASATIGFCLPKTAWFCVC